LIFHKFFYFYHWDKEKVLDLTYIEVDAYLKCITDDLYDDKKFNAALHGAKLKTPTIPAYAKKISSQRSTHLDNMAEKLMERMKAKGGKK
jgi:hypothetical protein